MRELVDIQDNFDEAIAWLNSVSSDMFHLHHDTDGEWKELEQARDLLEYAMCLLRKSLDPLADHIETAQEEYNKESAMHD